MNKPLAEPTADVDNLAQDGPRAAGGAPQDAPQALDYALMEKATGYLAGGISLVPCSPHTKRPENRLLPKDETGKATWKPYQSKPETPAGDGMEESL